MLHTVTITKHGLWADVMCDTGNPQPRGTVLSDSYSWQYDYFITCYLVVWYWWLPCYEQLPPFDPAPGFWHLQKGAAVVWALSSPIVMHVPAPLLGLTSNFQVLFKDKRLQTLEKAEWKVRSSCSKRKRKAPLLLSWLHAAIHKWAKGL